jgi:hypothetical protein
MKLVVEINWIKTEEGLPQEGQEVIISGHGYSECKFRKGKFWVLMHPSEAVNCLNCGEDPYYEVPSPEFWAPYPELPTVEYLQEAYRFDCMSPEEKRKEIERRHAKYLREKND